MANYWVRCLLSSAIFPFASEFWGRSIILHMQDQNYDTAAINAPGVVIDKGIPQVFYAHNVVPTEQGFQSIGYEKLISAFSAVTTDFGPTYQLQTASGGRFLYSPADGKNYIYTASTGAWQSVSPMAPGTVPANTQVSTAFVHGETYIYYAGIGCFKYDPAGNVMVAVVLAGLVPADILGITNANNYMIAYTKNAIAWSSVIDPTDFVPSIVTGAGGGQVNEAEGDIVACLQISGGFMVYCQYNTVFAKYSGNINFPFITKEVAGSGGVTDINQITWQTNLDTHYAWTSAGLQQVGPVAAANVYPEFSDFIAAKIFEDFDEGTLQLTSEYLGVQLYLSLKVIEERFLIMSYGKTFGMYTHAIIYDIALKRYGKLKINHVACFEWNFPNFSGLITYGKLLNTTYGALINTTYAQLGVNIDPPKTFKQSICFLQADGTVQAVNFSVSEATANGILIIGKFQMDRNDWIEHQQTSIDTVGNTNLFDYYIFPSLDGKTLRPAQKCFLAQEGPRTRTYNKLIPGQNFSSLFKGAFNLNSMVINITLGGSSS